MAAVTSVENQQQLIQDHFLRDLLSKKRYGVPSHNKHFQTESLLFVGYVIKKTLLPLICWGKQSTLCDATTGFPAN